MKFPRKSRGMSLVITLAFIVIITILVVGFAETVRLARPAAASYLERARADQYARSGVERVIATLNQYTADTNRNWISQPGQLVAGGSAPGQEKILGTIAPLSSGSAPTSPPIDKFLAPPRLNIVTFRDPGMHLITETTDSGGSVPPMEVKWHYVRKSGEIDTNSPPGFSTNDPVVGRYAFWADDESSKINYNIAWGKTGNTNAPGHPTRVNLSSLTNFTQAKADILHAFVVSSPTNFNFFNTPFDARRVELTPAGTNSGLAAALDENKFQVTHFNSDPNTTFFNEPRIVLTTRPDRAGWSYQGGRWVGVNGLPWPNGTPAYLAILKDTSEQKITSGPASAHDPADSNNIDTTRVSQTLKKIVSYLKRKDWPMVSGTASLQEKYYGSYPTADMQVNRLNQMALNIIDYVRAKESSTSLILPLRGKYDPATGEWSNQDSASNSYFTITRTPYVTEMGARFMVADQDITRHANDFTTPAPGKKWVRDIKAGDYVIEFKFEIYLPPNYGLAEIDLTKLTMYETSSHVDWEQSGSGYGGFRFHASQISNPSNPGDPTKLKAGTYAVITHYEKSTLTPAGTKPAAIRVRMSLQRGATDSGGLLGLGNYFLNIIPVSLNSRIDLPIDPAGGMTSVETDDPRVYMSVLDWRANAPGVNSFGAPNIRSTLGKAAPGTLPQVDTDNTGNVSDASLHMPPPAGSKFAAPGGEQDNTRGQVMSAGELGYLHTGIEACSVVTDSNNVTYTVPVGGVSWRTLRLQPNKAGTSVVPDWAFMDLFTAPIAAPNQYNRYVYAPHDTSFGGRVNVNSRAEPFDLPRVAPLTAVLQDATYDAGDLGKTINATDAAAKALNIYNRVLASDGKQYGYAQGYDSAGEVVEIEGIADDGEKSEELYRQIANLLSTRGNVYSVYSIGQALQQAPSGKLSVVAEQRLQAMVERYADSTNATRFAPVYFRNLTP